VPTDRRKDHVDAKAVTDVPEHELVMAIFAHDILRGMVLSASGSTPDARVFLRVPGAEVSPGGVSKVGDVDALVVSPDHPELAAAYEFKRVKIARHTFDTGMPGKLTELHKAIHQANALATVGFSLVVLTIVVVTDGRGRLDFNFVFRGASAELLRTVDAALDLSDLDETVGVFRPELVQPVDADITLSGGMSAKVVRPPRRRSQPAALTESIKKLLSRGTAA
jgi:hypothetical protein